MRFIILMASDDEAVKKSFKYLYDHRVDISSQTEPPLKTMLTYDQEQKRLLITNARILKALTDPEISPENNQIEFLAHGNNNNPLLFYIKPRLKDDTFSITNNTSDAKGYSENNTDQNETNDEIPWEKIDPNSIAKFFNEMVNTQTRKYNFNSLTLFCCRSQLFGQELSKLIRDIPITCFKDDIKVLSNGIAYRIEDKTPYSADQFIFKSGVLISQIKGGEKFPFEYREEKIDETSSSNNLTTSDEYKPYILRGNPFEGYQQSSYIPTTADLKNDSFESDFSNSPSDTVQYTSPDEIIEGDEPSIQIYRQRR